MTAYPGEQPGYWDLIIASGTDLDTKPTRHLFKQSSGGREQAVWAPQQLKFSCKLAFQRHCVWMQVTCNCNRARITARSSRGPRQQSRARSGPPRPGQNRPRISAPVHRKAAVIAASHCILCVVTGRVRTISRGAGWPAAARVACGGRHHLSHFLFNMLSSFRMYRGCRALHGQHAARSDSVAACLCPPLCAALARPRGPE